MSNRTVTICSFLLTITTISDAARILAIIPTPSYSHQVVYQPLWRALSQRGHHLTVLTTDPMNDATLTNLTEIDLHFTYSIWTEKFTQIATEDASTVTLFRKIMALLNEIEVAILEDSQVEELRRSEGEYDLVIAEFSMIALYGFGRKFGCPIIGVTSLDAANYAHYIVGNPNNPAVYSDFTLNYGTKMGFAQRFASFAFSMASKFLGSDTILRKAEMMARYFGGGSPNLIELVEGISMLFLNVNPVYFESRPISPATLLIGGGIHIRDPKPLPKDIKDFLDKAETIYFSLGTNVKAKDLTPEMLQAFLDTFQKLPYQILWKYDKELLAIPPNVKVLKWIPQADVLRHKNVKLFITQGGLQSMEEAIFFHVPLVGMPFYLDQETNVRTIVEKKIGLRILPKELDVPTFTKTILEVISNPTYKKNMEKLAKLALDQPMSGLEKAVWWTEYVLRHKGAKHLRRPLSEQLPMYQYLLLDVLAFVLGVLFTIVFILYKIYRFFRPKKIVRFFDDKKIN